ncbi:MAG: MarR family transcriptional regulator [Sphingomonadaceae bacterium]|nr:MarR family transcriptional regulator [Sphingomonadaceae bacterium]MCP5383129.1 MarR family transcriptional regulator [Altererythrobacter sp.]MCP5390411.1 MarR family transcriptional regulator [Sphingomonadaceae bacterium]MCP5393306.1 MarR family transcriptional regulator [Sphingomonadaceae bacterium]
MERIAILASDIGRLLRREFDQRAKSAGLTRPQWRLLMTLRDREGINQGELAELLLVEPITVCRMVDRLEESGMLVRRADPADRRSWRLHLEPRARRLLEELRPTVMEFLADIFDGIPDDERQATVRTLEKLRANLVRTNDGQD